MDETRLIAELVDALDRLGVTVRRELLPEERHGAGGYCLLLGQPTAFVDERAPLREQIAVLASILGRLDTDAVFLAPAVRELLDQSATGRISST